MNTFTKQTPIDMKKLAALLVLGTFISTASAQNSMQMINASEFDPQTKATFTYVVTHTTITITTENGLVSTLELPKGVNYSVQLGNSDLPILRETPFRKTFIGDVVIRVRHSDEISEAESTDSWTAMQQAPFQLALSNVTVKVNDHYTPGFHPHE